MLRVVRQEGLALVLILAVLVGLPLAALRYEKSFSRQFTATVWARQAERGGFQPAEIRVREGEKVRLRVIGDDVVHGLAIPDLGVSVPEIKPGEEKIVEFTAEKAGTYPFFCTVLCSPRHGYMKGAIIVEPR